MPPRVCHVVPGSKQFSKGELVYQVCQPKPIGAVIFLYLKNLLPLFFGVQVLPFSVEL